MTNYDHVRLARILGGDDLAALRARLRRRFERGRTAPVLTLARVSARERDALAGLLGRRAREAGSMRVPLVELDEALTRAGLARSLRHALELLDGPIADLTAERVAREHAWMRAFALPTDPRLTGFMSTASNRGLVRRLAGGDPQRAHDLLVSAQQVLSRLPAGGFTRSQLAANALGDAHALDSGRPVATLIVTALRTDDERPRDTWARAGVLVNELAKPALVLNLPAAISGSAAGTLAQAAGECGEPMHLSLRALMRVTTQWRVASRDIYVCENANLLAMAADHLGPRCAPLVCTDGMPSASQRVLLKQLCQQGAHLHYHGDFDWPGIRIGNYVMRAFGAVPWRFDTQHYQPGAGRPLRGRAVDASWDPSLRVAMEAKGFVLEEETESVASSLLADLTHRSR